MTGREKEVFHLIVAGSSNKEAAHVLFVTEKTIKWHLTNIYRKLKINSRYELRAKYK